MSTITINLPETIRESLEAQWQELPRFILEHLAVEGYRQGLLSQRQVGQMLGVDYWTAEEFLQAHKVYPNYGLEEFEQDLATLERLRQKQP
jgi:hypothetical protein